jgi:hypothetical protein
MEWADARALELKAGHPQPLSCSIHSQPSSAAPLLTRR